MAKITETIIKSIGRGEDSVRILSICDYDEQREYVLDLEFRFSLILVIKPNTLSIGRIVYIMLGKNINQPKKNTMSGICTGHVKYKIQDLLSTDFKVIKTYGCNPYRSALRYCSQLLFSALRLIILFETTRAD